jgi:hypothetical protein
LTQPRGPVNEQVVGATQQLPLGIAGAKPPAQEPPRPLLLLELAEDRLDGLLALGVAGLAVMAGQLRRHRGAQPVASGRGRLAVLAGLALPAVPGWWDQQLRRVRDRGQVGDRPVAAVGQQRPRSLGDAGGAKRRCGGGEHRVELLQVVGLLGQLGGDDHLLARGDRLGVVALHAAPPGVHEAAVRVGDIGGRLGVGRLVTAPRRDVRPGLLALGPGRGGQLGDPLLIPPLALGRLGLQEGLGLPQPRQPAGFGGQRLGQLVPTGWAVLQVLVLVGLGGLAEDLGDLGLELLPGVAGGVGGVGGHLGAVQRHQAEADQAGGGAQPQRLNHEAGQGLLVADPEPRDGYVVGELVASQHPERQVLGAAPLQLPRGPHPQAVAVQQHAQQQLRVVGGMAVPVGTVGAVERH